jgi:hypothetical protein
VSEYAIPKGDLLTALTQITSAYQRQNAVLSEISRTSEEMATAMGRPDSIGAVDELLELRGRQCEQLMEVAVPLELQIERAVSKAGCTHDVLKDELEALARTINAMQSDSRCLMESIMSYQAKCETVLRARLDDTAKAIGESVQKRKINTAYGPAHGSRTPRYIDKQR